MKALSIRQPWAWAIVHAGKRVENRSWRTDYRGEILIHASKLRPIRKNGLIPVAAMEDMLDAIDFMRDRNVRPKTPVTYRMLLLQSGAIVGRARIVDCVTKSDSPWFVGPFGLVLADVCATPVVPCKGALGLWDVPASVMRYLETSPSL